VLRLGAIVAGGVLLGVSILGFADERLWIAALATSLRAQLLVLALGVLTVGGLARSVTASVLAVATLVINGVVLAPLYTADPAEASGTARLRLAHVNMQRSAVDEESLLEALQDRRPDVLAVLEPPRGWEPSPPAGYRVLRRPDQNRVLLIASTDLRRVRKPHWTLPSASLFFDVRLGSRTVTVLAAHPPAPTSPGSEESRDSDLRRVAGWARSHPGSDVVIGDLNATPWSSAIAKLESDGDLHDSAEGFGLQATWPAALGPLGVQIDHVLHSDDLTVVERETGPTFGSEHRSLWATLALAQGATNASG
jgi:endonuclease/exonuclease/phosphatase (EEP) superfamily protein YafD